MAYKSWAYISSNYLFISTGLLIIFLVLINFIIDLNIHNKKIRLIVKGGVLFRALIIIIDNYFELISFGGLDGKVFHNNGYLGLNNFVYWRLPYVKSIVVPSYKLLGEAVPIFLVLLNLLCYTLAMIFLYKNFNLIKYGNFQRKKMIFIILSFSPILALYNVSLLREGIMLLFTTFSIYSYMKKEKIYYALSILSLFISSYLHSGMIFILFGYIYNYIIKQKGKKKIIYILLGICLLTSLLVIIPKLPYFKGKNLEKLADSKVQDGGSRYATEVSGVKEYIVYSPIRLFYFLFSPTPNMFRGLRDILSFLLNSCVYIFFIYDSLKNYIFIREKTDKKERIFIQSLFLSFFLTAFIYGLGTDTAGTALRHRDKLLFLLALINFYIYSKKERLLKMRKQLRRKRCLNMI